MNEQEIEKLEALFRQQYGPLCRYVCQIVGCIDDAVELVQESFLRFWKLQQESDGGCMDVPLLFRLARNLAIDALRKNAVRDRYAQRTREGKVVVLPVTPEQVVLRRERQDLAEMALRELSEKQQLCLKLRGRGLSYDEIAESLGVNRESIGPTLTRALRKFRTVYTQLVEAKPEEPGHAASQ